MKQSLLTEALRARLLSDPRQGRPSAAVLKDREEIARLELTSADVDPILKSVVAANRSTPKYAAWLIQSVGVEILWDGGRPALKTGSMAKWMRLLDDFDPDVLLCCHLLDSTHSVDRDPSRCKALTLDRWGPHVHAECSYLAHLLDAGFADMHVHLGGIRQPADVWRRLVTGTLDIESAVPRPQARSIRPPRIPDRLSVQVRESIAFRSRHVPSLDPEEPRLFAACERRWCMRLALVLHDGSDEFDGIDRHDAECYFWLKHHLWRGLRQPQEGTTPGLLDFSRVWFKAVPRDVSVRAKRTRSSSVVAREHQHPLAMLLDQPKLKRLELRMSPLGRASAYGRFFRAWSTLEAQLRDKLGHLPDIAFSIHLQRNASGGGKRPLELLDKFDFETAGLHLFRHNDADNSPRVARIDLAAVERDGPTRYAAPFFRLLRGDPSALEALKQGRIRGERLHNWRELHSRNLAPPHFNASRLGASCHAGEDFGALIVGLKEVADAIDGMQLREGDSIGHGLAMGWNPVEFENRIGWTAIVPTGELLDALIWLRLELDHGCPADANRRVAAKVEEWIDKRLKDLYATPEAALLVRGQADLRRYREASLSYPLVAKWHDNDRNAASIDELVFRRYEDPRVLERFNEPQTWAECVERSLPVDVLVWLQRQLRSRCARHGIVVELHPSSNLRISGLPSMRDGPTLQLLLAEEPFPRAIGTDDPGVFATDVACEYALAYEELIAYGLSRDQALEKLDRCRNAALHAIRWPAGATIGRE